MNQPTNANPYAGPQSRVTDISHERGSAKRPAWVWVSAALLGFFAVANIVVLALGLFAVTPDFAAAFERLNGLDFAIRLIHACLILTAAVLLFMLRLRAILFLWLPVGMTAATDVLVLISKGPDTLFRTTLHVVLWGLVLSYAYRLKARGILR